jgi:hypothetical protein
MRLPLVALAGGEESHAATLAAHYWIANPGS